MALVEPLIEPVSNPTPKEHAGKEIAKDRPEGVAFIFHCHFELLTYLLLAYYSFCELGDLTAGPV